MAICCVRTPRAIVPVAAAYFAHEHLLHTARASDLCGRERGGGSKCKILPEAKSRSSSCTGRRVSSLLGPVHHAHLLIVAGWLTLGTPMSAICYSRYSPVECFEMLGGQGIRRGGSVMPASRDVRPRPTPMLPPGGRRRSWVTILPVLFRLFHAVIVLKTETPISAVVDLSSTRLTRASPFVPVHFSTR